MLYANDFEAFISVDGKEVPQYGIQLDEKKRQMSCWIASEPGKKFSVNWACCQNNIESRGDVYVNRENIGCEYIINPDWNLPLEKRKQLLRVSKSQFANKEDFVFSDNGTEITAKFGIPSTGIQVRVFSLVQGAPKHIKNDHSRKLEDKDLRPPHLFGNDKNPLIRAITFTFHYQSLDRLQSEGITTRPPSIINPYPRHGPNAKLDGIEPFSTTSRDLTSCTTEDGLPSQECQNHDQDVLQLSENSRRKRDLLFGETAPHTDKELEDEISDLKKRLDELYLIQSYRKRASAQGRVRLPKQRPFERPRSDWYKYPGAEIDGGSGSEPVGKKRKLEEDVDDGRLDMMNL